MPQDDGAEDGAHGSTPRPDPTRLTTQQLLREIDSLQALVFSRVDAIEAGSIARNVHLREFHDEKFRSIQTQFSERDTRTEQTSRDSKVAVDAALQAAKEAVAEQNRSSALAISKSEAATMKQIDQQSILIQTGTNASDGKINDLKDRVALLEGRDQGSSSSLGWMVGVGGLLVAIIAAVAAVALVLRMH
jgi:hypothetical protein